MRLTSLLLAGQLVLAACSGSSSSSDHAAAGRPHLKAGPWHGTLTVAGHQQLPFELDVLPDSAGHARAWLLNGGERFRLTDFDTVGRDSLRVGMHIFEAALVGRVTEGAFTGFWQKFDAKTPYRVPFRLEPGRLPARPVKPAPNYTGTWAVTFTDPADGSSYPAVGVFEQKKGQNGLTGTFLTTTGDYRYLRGEVRRDSLRLYTFDGSHGFVFTALWQPDGSLKGDFWSGLQGHETWVARRDPNAKLPDANSLAGVNAGAEKLDFTFPNVYEGGSVSPADPKYQGKVVVVQILGSWCPNCMDETNFLAPWYEQNKQRGVEVIGLGYEKTPDQQVAATRLRRLRERLHVGYDLAVAGQEASTKEVMRTLPQLRDVQAFPTTIFLDKQGRIRKVHTGFSGPGTGEYYEKEKAEFTKTIDQLLAEK